MSSIEVQTMHDWAPIKKDCIKCILYKFGSIFLHIYVKVRSNFNRKGVQNMHKYVFMNAFLVDEDEVFCDFDEKSNQWKNERCITESIEWIEWNEIIGFFLFSQKNQEQLRSCLILWFSYFDWNFIGNKINSHAFKWNENRQISETHENVEKNQSVDRVKLIYRVWF